METKLCTKCGEEKPKSGFSKDRNTKDGLQANCKCCKNKLNACWRESNIEKHRENASAWAYANRDRRRIHDHNRRVRMRANGGLLSIGIENRLYKLQKGKCACCKQPLGNDYHLDHIMPLALGGSNTDENMQLLRSKCNMQKHTKHPVEFMQSRGFLL